MGFYDKTKESEKNVVRERICDLPEGSKVTLDALNNSEGLLTDIEQNNRIRDVNFGEDKFRSLNRRLQKITSSLMLFICSGLSKINTEGNLNILREELVYNSKMINKFFAA